MAKPNQIAVETELWPSRGRLLTHFALVLGAAFAVGAGVGNQRTAASAALGVALCGFNLMAMRRITNGLTRADGGSALWALALPFKLVALVGIAFLLVKTRVAGAVPLALGFAALPLTAVFLPRPKPAGRAPSPIAPPPSASPAEPLEVLPRA
jgi:hypothetical protein